MQLLAFVLTVVALLSTITLAAPAPGPGEVPAALADRNPQLCECAGYGCYDSCGQPFCC